MGTVIQLYNEDESFIAKFRNLYKQTKERKEYLELLKWVISYYSDSNNEKQYPLFSVLSVIYHACPECLFDYVKDYDSLEREFMVTAKIMFEEDYIDKELIDKWRYEVLGKPSLSKVNVSKLDIE